MDVREEHWSVASPRHPTGDWTWVRVLTGKRTRDLSVYGRHSTRPGCQADCAPSRRCLPLVELLCIRRDRGCPSLLPGLSSRSQLPEDGPPTCPPHAVLRWPPAGLENALASRVMPTSRPRTPSPSSGPLPADWPWGHRGLAGLSHGLGRIRTPGHQCTFCRRPCFFSSTRLRADDGSAGCGQTTGPRGCGKTTGPCGCGQTMDPVHLQAPFFSFFPFLILI